MWCPPRACPVIRAGAGSGATYGAAGGNAGAAIGGGAGELAEPVEPRNSRPIMPPKG